MNRGIHICLRRTSDRLYGKMDKCIFIQFSAKIQHETGNNREHFRDVSIKPLNPGSIFLFPGFVFVSNIMEKRVNGFS